MDTIFEKMKSLILFNLDTISKLIDEAESMRSSITTGTDEALKAQLLTQVDSMEVSIQKLIGQTKELFEAYKQLVNNSR